MSDYRPHLSYRAANRDDEQYNRDTDATITALREAYREYANSADGAGSVQTRVVQRLVEAVFTVLADTAPAAAQARERIEAPWREALTAMVGHYEDTTGFNDEPCLTHARALLAKPDSEDVTP